MDALLQMPQLEEVNTWRLNFCKSTEAGFLSHTSITFPSERTTADVLCELLSFDQQCGRCRISFTSSMLRIIPSVSKNPAANSRSSPGVRITTAMLWPSTRISSGSSAAIKSESSDSVAPFSRRIEISRTRCKVGVMISEGRQFPIRCFRRFNGYHNGFGGRLIAFIRHVADGHEHIRLRKIGGGAARRNFIRNHFEALRAPRLGLEVADQIHPLI